MVAGTAAAVQGLGALAGGSRLRSEVPRRCAEEAVAVPQPRSSGRCYAARWRRGSSCRMYMYADLMSKIETFSDVRLVSGCAFCGSPDAGTVDHAPARVFLDLPYPAEELPKVQACASCNGELSLDEEYVACALDIAFCGGVDSPKQRPKVRDALLHSAGLAARLRKAITTTDGRTVLHVESGRFKRVVTKLAQAHVVWELGTQLLTQPAGVRTHVLHELAAEDRQDFEEIPTGVATGPDGVVVTTLPELGSRAFMRLLVVGDKAFPESDGWVVVQEGRYRYAAFESDGGYEVRVVLSEYLGAVVTWKG